MGSGTDLLPRLSEIEGDIFASTLTTLIPLEDGDYRVIINEPVIVFAAENLFDQAGKNWIQEAFGKQLIQHAAKITVAEKSNLIESLIAYRFRQRWWEKSGALRELFNGTQWFEFLRSPPLPDDYPYYLPSIFNFVEDENFHRHFTGTIRDCTQFASLRLPSTNEPPNIVFKDKLGFVKTNWSKRQKCEPENSNALLDDATKIPNETHRKFLKFRIELPFSSDPNFKQHDLENGIVNIDLSQRQLAIDLLGETFYEKYCQFIGQFLES
jgi:hypothetical protein